MGRHSSTGGAQATARGRWAYRTALVGALAASLRTSALADESAPVGGPGDPTGPTTVEALASAPSDLSPPPSMVSPLRVGAPSFGPGALVANGAGADVQEAADAVSGTSRYLWVGTTSAAATSRLAPDWLRPKRCTAGSACGTWCARRSFVMAHDQHSTAGLDGLLRRLDGQVP